MSPRDKVILVLKTGEALAPVKARRGDFEDWIARGLGREADEVEVVAPYLGDPLPRPERLAGVVVTGSPGMVSDREAWSEASARWLAEIVERDQLPVLGLCYGHQLLAHGLGGEVGPNPQGREMGTVEIRFHAGSGRAGGSGSEDGLAPLFEVGAIAAHMSHVESVIRPPRGARVLASSVLEPHAALRFGRRQWGVQFHPEFDGEIMQLYVEARREILAAEGHDPDELIADAQETPGSTRVLARFAQLVDRS